MYAAKYARDAGLSVIVLEARDAIGGVWNFSDDPETITVMRNTVSSSSRHVTEASDFSMGEAAGHFFRHQDALAYLNAYADRFGLRPLIETGASVAAAEKRDGLWHVRTRDGRRFTATRLAVCTGVHQRRRPLSGPVLDFAGQRLHAGNVKDTADLNVGPDEHIVVYGGGETAADIVQDLASKTDAKITWAIRGGQHFFRKTPLRQGGSAGTYDRHDMPLDVFSSAIIGLMSPPELGKPGMRHRCNLASSASVFSYQGHGVGEWVNDTPWFRQFFNKNGHALEHVWNGRVTPAPAITQCEGDTVAFENGTQCRATRIVCCFGYVGNCSFLPENLRLGSVGDLHRLVFHPDDPSLAFFGFARPTILSIPYMTELQCLYAMNVWSGALPTPDPSDCRADIEADAAALEAWFGAGRTNPNIVCPFWYTQKMLRLIGQERTEARVLLRRFHPLKDWRGFSMIMRTPLSPLLIRLLLADAGEDERRRMGEYISSMPYGFRRDPDASLARYAAAYVLAIGLPRLLRLDPLFDWMAKRRIARHGRAIPLRSAAGSACAAPTASAPVADPKAPSIQRPLPGSAYSERSGA